jgi:hypothetical protein
MLGIKHIKNNIRKEKKESFATMFQLIFPVFS